MTERQIELQWRCTSCGLRNLGRHLICQSCGSPKDDGEHYEMPVDPSQVASVTDPNLVAVARAGANWRCGYCGSDARNPDGSCAQCGATRAEAPAPPPHVMRIQPRASAFRSIDKLVLIAGGVVAMLLVGFIALGLLARRAPRPPPPPAEPEFREVSARVQSVSWVHRVYVERWQIVEREGFEEQKPSTAFEVKRHAQRVHHVDKVPDGTTTEQYVDQETKMVSETYTDSDPCGQDCTPLPQTCREECTNNQNGFATCRQVCSGGGQDCQTRYCTVTKTRMVQKTTPVTKTRTVPKLKDVERMATWFSWKVWDWAPARTVEAKGSDFEPHFPSDDEIALGKDLGKDEKERERRVTSYTVVLLGNDGTRHQLAPRTADELARWQNARATLRVRRYGGVELASGPLPAAP